MHRNLRSFLDLLRRENDLITIDAEVDPYLEVAEIHRRVIEEGGPALLFKRVKGSRFPVVTNLFGTAKRIDLAFGPKPEQFIKQLVRVAESLLPPNRSELWKHRSLVRDFLKLGTRTVARAPVTELILASCLSGEKLRMAKNPAGGAHRLVAEAEFALIGNSRPHVRQPEGPFGDHYGYYSLKHDYPVFDCEAIAHRRDAIYPATVVGKPQQEDFFIGDYLQSLLSPIFPIVMPGVRDLWSYGETGFHSLAAAVVRERYSREALVAGFRILGEGQLAVTKFLILTDSPMDLRDFPRLLEHVLARVRWESDFFIFSNTSMDTLDYTSGKVNEGSKAILMGLGRPVRELPREFRGQLPTEVTRAEVFCAGCLVLTGAPYPDEPQQGGRLAQSAAF